MEGEGRRPSVSLSGHSAELMVSYQVAARLGPWELLPGDGPRCFVFSGRLRERHGYWANQRPMDLLLHVAQIEWRWDGVSPVFGDDGKVTVHISTRPVVTDRTREGRRA